MRTSDPRRSCGRCSQLEGLVVKADTTTWTPGSRAGFYGYRGGAWHFLG